MQRNNILFTLCALCYGIAILAFTINKTPFGFERRYNANSFILNNKRYYSRYKPKKQSMGNEAIANIIEKKQLAQTRAKHRTSASD